jgi:hypothetical protein
LTPPARRAATAFALLVAAGIAAWLMFRPEPRRKAVEPPVEVAEAPLPPEVEAPRPRAAAPAPRPAARPADEVVTSDGLPIMPAGANDPRPDGPVHPHPITPQHQRIYRENRLVGELNGAMDVKDVPALRRMLEEYRRDYPEDDNMLQDGYAVIADCLERPGDDARAAATRWAETHRGSTLRRFVNRHCLE